MDDMSETAADTTLQPDLVPRGADTSHQTVAGFGVAHLTLLHQRTIIY